MYIDSDTAAHPSAAAAEGAPDWGRVWTNRFASLGAGFFSELAPQPLPDPHWVAVSIDCARALGLPSDWAERADWRALAVLSGNANAVGMRPLASVYSGHQFGVWAGQLGDGRPL